MNKSRYMYLLFALVTVFAIALSACGPSATPTEAPAPAPTTAPEPTKAPEPTAAPTEPPAPSFGTADNPIVVAFEPSGTSQEITAGGQALLDLLSQETGLTFKGVVPTSYAALTEAMGSGNAQIGWMATFAYILAHQKGYAEVALITNRFGSDHYGSQFIANVDSGFTPAADQPGTDLHQLRR